MRVCMLNWDELTHSIGENKPTIQPNRQTNKRPTTFTPQHTHRPDIRTKNAQIFYYINRYYLHVLFCCIFCNKIIINVAHGTGKSTLSLCIAYRATKKIKCFCVVRELYVNMSTTILTCPFPPYISNFKQDKRILIKHKI